MKLRFWILCGLVFALLSLLVTFDFSQNVVPCSGSSVRSLPGPAPFFEANRGQADETIDFLFQGSEYQLGLTHTGTVLYPVAGQSEPLFMQLVESNPGAVCEGRNPLKSHSNYLIGKNPDAWLRNVSHFGEVLVQSVWPGIDLVYHGRNRAVEFDFVLSPGTDPDQVRLRFSGGKSPEITPDGDLRIPLGEEEVIYKKPEAWQENGEEQIPVQVAFSKVDEFQVTFDVGVYDPEHTLVIDPQIVFSYYLADKGGNRGQDIEVDDEGYIYVTGTTSDIFFPTTNDNLKPSGFGGALVFVSKLTPDGSEFVYSTIFGGSSNNTPRAMAVDATGHVTLAGHTQSDNFPVVNAFQPEFNDDMLAYAETGEDGFVCRLNPEGNQIVYSSYLGGIYEDRVHDVVVDSDGNAYVTGFTRSEEKFPVKNAMFPTITDGGSEEAFTAKIANDGTLMWSTYMGGISIGNGIVLDGQNNIYITGKCQESYEPTGGAYVGPSTEYNVIWNMAFVTKLNNQGSSILFSSYLGAKSEGRAIAVHESEFVCVTGWTSLDDFPTVRAFQNSKSTWNDGFVCKLSLDGSKMLYSTFIGGNDNDYPSDVAVTGDGNIYISGHTKSTDLWTVNSFQDYLAGQYDAFFAKISSEEELVFSTYFGGSHWEGGGEDTEISVAVGPFGYLHATGYSSSQDFPFDAEPDDADGRNVSHVYVLKMQIDEKGELLVTPDPVQFPLTLPGQNSTETVQLANTGAAVLQIINVEVEPESEFSLINKPNLPFELEENEAVELEVRYHPGIQKTLAPNRQLSAGTLTVVSDAQQQITPVALEIDPTLIVNDARDDSDPDGDGDVYPEDEGVQFTLRAAIEKAHTMPGDDPVKIIFAIQGENVPIIQLKKALPLIERPIEIDATTQEQDYVVVDGCNNENNNIGFVMNSGNSTLKGLNIIQFGGCGVSIEGPGNNRIENCVVNLNGRASAKNGCGIRLLNSDRNTLINNVISQNYGHGLVIRGRNSSRNRILSNKIGCNISGTVARPNTGSGILLTYGANENNMNDNTISGNAEYGVQVGGEDGEPAPSANTIKANFIGVTGDGSNALGNGQSGIWIWGKGTKSNEIHSNIISGNFREGIQISYFSELNHVFANHIGTDGAGEKILPNDKDGVLIDYAENNHITDNTIAGNLGHGISFIGGNKAMKNLIENNRIGIGEDGLDSGNTLGNKGCGIYVEQGNARLQSNEVASHNSAGIFLNECAGGIVEFNTVHNNTIGIQLEDSKNPLVQKNILFSNQHGITIDGFTVFLQGNVIRENTGTNTGISVHNAEVLIQGNQIKDDAGNGIVVSGESEVTVLYNNISGNQGSGLTNLMDSRSVNAQFNWWGDETGPGGDGPGSGDAVIGKVNSTIWQSKQVSVFVAAEADTVEVEHGSTDSILVMVENWLLHDDNVTVSIQNDLGWLQSEDQFTVNVADEDNSVVPVYFTVPEAERVGAINPVTFTASSGILENDTHQTRCYLKVTSSTIQGISVYPDSAEVAPGDTIQIYASGFDQFNQTLEISPDWLCTGGSIDEQGLFIAGNETGTFWIRAVDPVSGLEQQVTVIVATPASAVHKANDQPATYRLDQNYPNPFNPVTRIRYAVPEAAHVAIEIYNIQGRRVRTLVDRSHVPGEYSVKWDGRDDYHTGVSGGIYMVRIVTADYQASRKMLFIR